MYLFVINEIRTLVVPLANLRLLHFSPHYYFHYLFPPLPPVFYLPSRVYTSPSSPLYQCFLFVFLPQPIIILDSPVVLLVFALYCELFATTYVTSSLMPLSFRLTVPHPPHPTLLYLSIFKTIVTCPPLLSPFTSNSLLCQWSNLPWEGRKTIFIVHLTLNFGVSNRLCCK